MSANSPGDPVPNLTIGTIIEVDGTRIVAELDSEISELTRVFGGIIYPIGQFGSIVRIHFGRTIIYGYVSRLRMKTEYQQERGITQDAASNARVVEADLFGEGEWTRSGNEESEWKLKFDRGVSTFPLPQQRLYLTPRSELRFVFGQGGSAGIQLGEHVGSGGTPAFADLNELLGKHTAVLGSTGAGKSGTVAAILHSILEYSQSGEQKRWNPCIVVLDPHNEYGDAFKGHRRLSTDEGSLVLPYWLLDLQETIGLVIGKTEFVATSQANIVKQALLKARQEGATTVGIDPAKITVDSPVPYKIDRFVELIEADKPPQASKQESHNSILQKIDTLLRDARLAFLMTQWDGEGDLLTDVISQFMGAGEPLRIVDLSGVPNEVAGTASAAIARLLFSTRVWQHDSERQRSPTLLVCEEAHRYVPNRGEAQYEAAQQAVRRLAKEGRKYGVGLMLVSQRPSEVEATVLSQCNSWIVLRVTNDSDREHVRSVLPDSLAGLTKALSGLRRREAVFVGQATTIPSRILVRPLTDAQLPRSQDVDFAQGWSEDPLNDDELKEVGSRWREQRRPAVGDE
ncbi:MAG: ATP-binding protein [Phycisphaeraceae bacterium]